MSDLSDSSMEASLTESSSSEDLEWEHLMEERKRPKNENFFEETIPQYNDSEFQKHFRVSRELATQISQQFKNSEYFKEKTGPYRKLTAMQHLLIFLWFAGHQTACFRDVADRFNISISSLHRVLQRMIYFLSNISVQVIKWPNIDEQNDIEAYFFQKNGFPGIIGISDGTHIKIDKPAVDPDSYINRKGFYSLQVQLVCDNKLRIRSIFTGYPGSVHDARVFRTSPLCQSLAVKCGDKHILGDSAYPLMVNVLTPFQNRGMLTRRQILYNVKFSSNRILIEHCIGVSKQKWRKLYHIKFRNIRLIAHFIRACCVLHNLSINDNFEEADRNYEEDVEDVFDRDEERELNGIAVQRRNAIVNLL